MKKLWTVIMMTIIVCSSVAFAQGSAEGQPGSWNAKTPMPTARLYVSTCVVGNTIYAIGGTFSYGLKPVVEVYDPVADVWTKKADMPRPMIFLSTAVVGGKIYVIGGYGAGGNNDQRATVEEYDPSTETWTKKADLPIPTKSPVLGVVNGKIYAFGGRGSTRKPTSAVWQYDPLTDAWTERAPMAIARYHHSAAVMDGKIYVFGGVEHATGGPGDREPISAVEVYDPATDTWTSKADMPTARILHCAVALNERIYVIGGGKFNATQTAILPYPTVDIYHPATDTWTAGPDDMLITRVFFAANALNGSIYAIGGSPSGKWRNDISAIVEEYTP